MNQEISPEELSQMESRAMDNGPLKSSHDILRLVVEVRKLRHMVQNQEDGLTKQGLIIESLNRDLQMRHNPFRADDEIQAVCYLLRKPNIQSIEMEIKLLRQYGFEPTGLALPKMKVLGLPLGVAEWGPGISAGTETIKFTGAKIER